MSEEIKLFHLSNGDLLIGKVVEATEEQDIVKDVRHLSFDPRQGQVTINNYLPYELSDKETYAILWQNVIACANASKNLKSEYIQSVSGIRIPEPAESALFVNPDA